MTKKETKASPSTPPSNERAPAKDNSLAEVKKFSRWKTVEVKLEILKDGKHQGCLIGDGVPYTYYFHTCRNLEMKSTHMDRVRKRLIPGKHYIEISKEEIKEIYPVIHEAWMIRNFPPVFYFLTEEGFNRLILEIDTAGMKNKEAAARIESRKDDMVEIFTRYQHGEVLSINGPIQSEKIDDVDDYMRGLARYGGHLKRCGYDKHGVNRLVTYAGAKRLGIDEDCLNLIYNPPYVDDPLLKTLTIVDVAEKLKVDEYTLMEKLIELKWVMYHPETGLFRCDTLEKLASG